MRTEAPCHRSTSAFGQHLSVDVCHNHTPLQAVACTVGCFVGPHS
jgi:hypothetical protein